MAPTASSGTCPGPPRVGTGARNSSKRGWRMAPRVDGHINGSKAGGTGETPHVQQRHQVLHLLDLLARGNLRTMPRRAALRDHAPPGSRMIGAVTERARAVENFPGLARASSAGFSGMSANPALPAPHRRPPLLSRRARRCAERRLRRVRAPRAGPGEAQGARHVRRTRQLSVRTGLWFAGRRRRARRRLRVEGRRLLAAVGPVLVQGAAVGRVVSIPRPRQRKLPVQIPAHKAATPARVGSARWPGIRRGGGAVGGERTFRSGQSARRKWFRV